MDSTTSLAVRVAIVCFDRIAFMVLSTMQVERLIYLEISPINQLLGGISLRIGRKSFTNGFIFVKKGSYFPK